METGRQWLMLRGQPVRNMVFAAFATTVSSAHWFADWLGGKTDGYCAGAGNVPIFSTAVRQFGSDNVMSRVEWHMSRVSSVLAFDLGSAAAMLTEQVMFCEHFVIKPNLEQSEAAFDRHRRERLDHANEPPDEISTGFVID